MAPNQFDKLARGGEARVSFDVGQLKALCKTNLLIQQGYRVYQLAVRSAYTSRSTLYPRSCYAL